MFCLPCGGLILPDGFLWALRWNAEAERRKHEPLPPLPPVELEIVPDFAEDTEHGC